MLSRQWISRVSAVLASAVMLTASIDPAPAFTFPTPSLERSVAAAQIEKVWWRRWGWGCGWGCGWGPFAIVGAAGALATGLVAAPIVGVGRAVAGPPYWGPGYYGPGYAGPAYYPGSGPYGPGPYGPCWRRVWGAGGGWQWTRVC
jgi:hypothetical protein